MFDKILIANRGEIACRVMDTARSMGVRTVAVYSDADWAARHIAMADEAVYIGAAPAAESYLRIEAVIEAALQTGAQAVHPGYGFLSENPEFVEALEKAGITFIGPSSDAIRAMGLKDAAKALMEKAGVPVVPGYHGTDQDPEMLAAKAQEIGFPMLIKAVAGGGGKGMRLVETQTDFSAALNEAQSEARAAFGNDAVLIEKFVSHPRHIEIQVFGDGARAVHLFERDCSLQRRHQKVIEEAPAPGITDEVREAMGQAAVRAAEAIGYKGAGTVEFIVDGSGPLRADGFWFMEMNTRLQVEHPVTEAITGVDLVEWQLRVAAGEPLPLRQQDLQINGHAFEARLYAEDASNGFLPVTGRLQHLRFPHDVRADTGVRSGDEISPHYDPMVAKLITHGSNRAIALQKMCRALEDTQVAGTVTNLAFLRALAGHDAFASGQVDTGLIGRNLDALTERVAPQAEDWAAAALVGLGLAELDSPETGFALWAPLSREVHLRCGEATERVSVKSLGADAHDIHVQGKALNAARLNGTWRIDGKPVPAYVTTGGTVTLFTRSGLTFELSDPLAHDANDADLSDQIEAPMPGLVKAVFVSAGDAVAAGDRLMVLEAMKMEHALLAPRDGTISEVLVASDDRVSSGAALIRLDDQAPQDP